jgi:hypothetical protein
MGAQNATTAGPEPERTAIPIEVPSAVCRLFGFARVTDEMNAAVEPHRDALVREGYLELQGVNLAAVSLARPSGGKN